MTAFDAVGVLRKGEASPLDFVDAAIARIEQADTQINALPQRRFEEARRYAKAFRPDADRKARPGWLAGLPIAVKDYNDLAGLPTTYGSPIFARNVARSSDVTVARLEAQGAIPLAKSNVPEFAGANTFNRVFGATRNPHDLKRTVGGSSGGSAAALATSMIWLATGNDLGGSLRIPASFCGIAGMRPSVGRVPRPMSVVPFDPLWVEGPMGRCVADLALMLDAQAHFDPRDPLSAPVPARPFSEAASHPRPPQRVAYTSNLGLGPIEPEIAAICEQAAQRLADAGASIDGDVPDFSGGIEAFHILRASLMASVRGPLLDTHRDEINPDIVWNIEVGLGQSGMDIARAERIRGSLFERVTAFFETHDALACPTVATTPFLVEQRFPTEINGQVLTSYIDWMYLTFVLTLLGCPVISVPVGKTKSGLPVGLQLMGRPRGDFELLGYARTLEQVVNLK
ncbi:MAG: amidase [Methylobacterium sp.]|nr:amidase [Methylobacterium sp.]